jgi:hypothetical protein
MCKCNQFPIPNEGGVINWLQGSILKNGDINLVGFGIIGRQKNKRLSNMDISRRSFLSGSAAAAFMGAAGGCASLCGDEHLQNGSW